MMRTTNFALLMRAFNLTPKQLAERLRADMSLISRWRTGSRRLMPGRHWVKKIAECFLAEDEKRENPILRALLGLVDEGARVQTREECLEALEAFLVSKGQNDPQYHQSTADLIGRLSDQTLCPLDIAVMSNAPLKHEAHGLRPVQKMALGFLENTAVPGQDCEMLLFCPCGMDFLIAHPAFGFRVREALKRAYHAGFRLGAVLRSCCRPADMGRMSGYWMAALLRGYVKSYHYGNFGDDDFRGMVFVIRGQAALRVLYAGKAHGYRAEIHFDSDTVERLYQRYHKYERPLVNRNGVSIPNGANGVVNPAKDGERMYCYLFMRTPQFGLLDASEYEQFYRLDPVSAGRLRRGFAPLIEPVRELPENAVIRHLYCSGTIDELLLEKRRMLPELSCICNRRVFLSAQGMADMLKRLRELIVGSKNFEVCFLSEDAFRDLSHRVYSQSGRYAAVWIDGADPAAATDPAIVSAVQQYGAWTWDRIPASTRSRAAALRKIDQWLRKAKLYGLDV